MTIKIANFVSDLKSAAIEAAKFLRKKSELLNKDPGFIDMYTGEREFVAECYRRLPRYNKVYPSRLLIEYYEPKRRERNPSPVYPDLAFHDINGIRTAAAISFSLSFIQLE